MDTEYFTHRHFKPSMIIAVVLSLTIVVGASLIGRGKLNLTGALLLPEPHDVTVIALTEPKLQEGIHISNIVFLRKEEASAGQRAMYAYHVQTSDKSDYFARLKFDTASAQWSLERFEKLHGSDTTPSTADDQ